MSMLQRRFYKDRLCWCRDYYGYYNHPSLKNYHLYWIIFTFEYLSLSPLNPPLSSCHASLSFRFLFLSKTLTPPMPTLRFQFLQFLLSSQLFSQFLFSLLFFWQRTKPDGGSAREIRKSVGATRSTRRRRRRRTTMTTTKTPTAPPEVRFGGPNAPQPP